MLTQIEFFEKTAYVGERGSQSQVDALVEVVEKIPSDLESIAANVEEAIKSGRRLQESGEDIVWPHEDISYDSTSEYIPKYEIACALYAYTLGFYAGRKGVDEEDKSAYNHLKKSARENIELLMPSMQKPHLYSEIIRKPDLMNKVVNAFIKKDDASFIPTSANIFDLLQNVLSGLKNLFVSEPAISTEPEETGQPDLEPDFTEENVQMTFDEKLRYFYDGVRPIVLGLGFEDLDAKYFTTGIFQYLFPETRNETLRSFDSDVRRILGFGRDYNNYAKKMSTEDPGRFIRIFDAMENSPERLDAMSKIVSDANNIISEYISKVKEPSIFEGSSYSEKEPETVSQDSQEYFEEWEDDFFKRELNLRNTNTNINSGNSVEDDLSSLLEFSEEEDSVYPAEVKIDEPSTEDTEAVVETVDSEAAGISTNIHTEEDFIRAISSDSGMLFVDKIMRGVWSDNENRMSDPLQVMIFNVALAIYAQGNPNIDINALVSGRELVYIPGEMTRSIASKAINVFLRMHRLESGKTIFQILENYERSVFNESKLLGVVEKIVDISREKHESSLEEKSDSKTRSNTSSDFSSTADPSANLFTKWRRSSAKTNLKILSSLYVQDMSISDALTSVMFDDNAEESAMALIKALNTNTLNSQVVDDTQVQRGLKSQRDKVRSYFLSGMSSKGIDPKISSYIFENTNFL